MKRWMDSTWWAVVAAENTMAYSTPASASTSASSWTFPWWLGGSGRSKYWAVATVAFSATLSGKMWVCMSMTLMGMLLRLG